MSCVWSVGDSLRCVRCGREVAVPDGGGAFPVYACGQQAEASAIAVGAGLGDRVATALNAVGITEERVQAVASKVGIKDCGCGRRRELLNQAGKRLGIG